MKSSILLALATVFVASVAGAQTTTRTVPVFEAAGTPKMGFPVGDRVDDARATMFRNDNGVAVHIQTEDLPEDSVFTVWLFECMDSIANGCKPFFPPFFGSAAITGDDDEVSIAFGLSGEVFNVGSQRPFVAFMLNHGAVDPKLIDGQLSNPGVPAGKVAPIQVAKFPPGGGSDDDDDDDD